MRRRRITSQLPILIGTLLLLASQLGPWWAIDYRESTTFLGEIRGARTEYGLWGGSATLWSSPAASPIFGNATLDYSEWPGVRATFGAAAVLTTAALVLVALLASSGSLAAPPPWLRRPIALRVLLLALTTASWLVLPALLPGALVQDDAFFTVGAPEATGFWGSTSVSNPPSTWTWAWGPAWGWAAAAAAGALLLADLAYRALRAKR